MIPTYTDKELKKLRILFMLTYMVSYITRINFGAIVLEISTNTGIPASLLSLALTASFFSYGAGQIISGYLGDRFQPKAQVSFGLLLTITMNLLVALCTNYQWMVLTWCVNGFAQSLLWPPMVRLMVQLFPGEEYNKTTVMVSWGSSFGTILIYLISPVWISLGGWETVFLFSAICGILMWVLWNRYCPFIPTIGGIATTVPQASKSSDAKKGGWKFLKTPFIWGVMGATVMQGALRDGVTTWMPSYIEHTYHFGNNISILSGVLLPLFAVACFQIASAIFNKMPNQPLLCSGLLFVLGCGCAFLLNIVSGENAVISIVLMALLTGCMHGINLILVCMLPGFFKHTGSVSTISGTLNACTYIGSTISTYGIAMLSEVSGWNTTITLWAFIALLGALLCFGCAPMQASAFHKTNLKH